MNKNLKVIVGSAAVALACAGSVKGSKPLAQKDIVSQYRDAVAGRLSHQVFKEHLNGVLAENSQALAQCFRSWYSLYEVVVDRIRAVLPSIGKENQEALNQYVSVIEAGAQSWLKLLEGSEGVSALIGEMRSDIEQHTSLKDVIRLAFRESATETQIQAESIRAQLELIQHTVDEMSRSPHS